MVWRIFLKIAIRQFKKCRRRTQPLLLQMDKCTGQLNQSLIKRAVWAMAILKPKLFQHIMRFIKKPAIKTIEITDIMRIATTAAPLLHHLRHFFFFCTHTGNCFKRLRNLPDLAQYFLVKTPRKTKVLFSN